MKGESIEPNFTSTNERKSLISKLPGFLRDRLRERTDFTQKNEFMWVSDMVTDSSLRISEIYGRDMGLQFTISFEGTDYRKVFDKVVDDLRLFALNGSYHMGWRNDDDESNFYGQFQVVPGYFDGRQYVVIDETKPEDSYASVSIRGVLEGCIDGSLDCEDTKMGSYYFSGDKRTIQLCGANIPIDEVQNDIQEIVQIVKTDR